MHIQKRLLQHVESVRLLLVVFAGLSLLSGILIVTQARSLAQIISDVFLARQSLSQVAMPLSILLLVILARATLVWGSELAANGAACAVKGTLRQRLFAHMLQLGPLYVTGERSGELVQTLSEGIESLDAYFSQLLPQVCATILIPMIILIAVFTIDALSGLVLLVTMPLLPCFMVLIGKQASAMTKRRWQLLSQMSAHFLDVLQGMTTLKLFGRSQAQQETIRQISYRFGDVTMKVLRIAFLSSLVLEMGATISTALVAVEIGLRLMYGQIPFESAFVVLLLTPEFFQPLRALGTQFHASMSSTAGAERIFDILETPAPEQTTHVSHAHRAPLPAVPRSLEFRDVSFSYRRGDDQHIPALKNVSFTLQRGQKVAVVGPSGAGKSTIAHLLLRFVEPEQGEIWVDDVSLRQFAVQEWRQLLAWQPQRPSLFDTTVAENIRMGCADATLKEIMQAAKQAHLHDVIQTLPQGYDTLIGERGTRLSGGQVQRLALARAFVRNAPILLLDEATSTLDPESEAQVLQAIDTETSDRIVLVIAHRLHTIKTADQIIVLKEGQVIAMGTHQTLLHTSEAYQELVKAYADEEILV